MFIEDVEAKKKAKKKGRKQKSRKTKKRAKAFFSSSSGEGSDEENSSNAKTFSSSSEADKENWGNTKAITSSKTGGRTELIDKKKGKPTKKACSSSSDESDINSMNESETKGEKTKEEIDSKPYSILCSSSEDEARMIKRSKNSKEYTETESLVHDDEELSNNFERCLSLVAVKKPQAPEVKRENLIIEKSIGDGNCWLRSYLKAMKSEENHSQLRARMVKFFEAKTGLMKAIILLNSLRQTLQKLKTPNSWGNQDSLRILMCMDRVKINLYYPRTKEAEEKGMFHCTKARELFPGVLDIYEDYVQDSQHTVNLIFVNGNHYDLVAGFRQAKSPPSRIKRLKQRQRVTKRDSLFQYS